jgi:hypothetical protein
MELNKICKNCKVNKNISEFHKNGNSFHPYCKPCRTIIRSAVRTKKPTEGNRICATCKISFDVSNFHGDISHPSGLQSSCKSCHLINSKKSLSTLDGFIKKLYKDIKNNALKRPKEISVNITIEDIHDLYKKQNGLCALSGLKMTHTVIANRIDKHIINNYNISIDRINSDLGYTKNNIQLVCAIINIMKNDLPNDNFIELCSVISNAHK